ncbi:hypothetical protein [Aestuariivirga sp.]|uniref:hypothetical protein n=1 Tax=Aestuariivirga sp. TaxID=2650926 RepID=UPI00391ACA3B
MWWLELLGTLAAAAAAWSSWAAANSARQAVDETREAARSSIFERLVVEYQSAEMADALRLLARTDLSNVEQSKEIDDARRRVHWYFKKVALLRTGGALPDHYVRHLLLNTHGLKLWRMIALPLSQRWDPDPTQLEWNRTVQALLDCLDGFPSNETRSKVGKRRLQELER